MSHAPVAMRPVGGPSRRDELDLTTAVAAVLEGWRFLLLWAGGTTLVALIVLLLQPKRFTATMTLSTISSGAVTANGIAASLLGANIQGGLQPTPPLLAQLVELPGVLRQVAASPVSGTSTGRIVDLIAQEAHADSIPDYRIPEVMRKLIRVSVQRETGTITLSVEHKDSVLARAIAAEILVQVRHTFVTATRAQASALREAQTKRVDSASNQLTDAEHRYVGFLARNRTIAPFSPGEVERQRLARNLQIAQQVYLQAVTDREAAVARELQDTPVLVVIDSMPASLPPIPRHRLLKLILTVFLTAGLGAIALVFRESVRPVEGSPMEGRARLRNAVGRLPGLGSRVPQGGAR